MRIIQEYITLLQGYGVGESTISRQRRRFQGAKIAGLGSSELQGRELGGRESGARREGVRSSELQGQELGAPGSGARRVRVAGSEGDASAAHPYDKLQKWFPEKIQNCNLSADDYGLCWGGGEMVKRSSCAVMY